MYVTRVPNRSSPPAVLLRESWREGGKVKTRTLANLSHWPETKVKARLASILIAEGADLCFGDNQPYAVIDPTEYTIPVQVSPRHSSLEIEIRQTPFRVFLLRKSGPVD